MNEADRKLLYDYLYGHADAVRLCEDIYFVAHVWDDLIDQDRVRTKEEIDSAFYRMRIAIPSNPFYVAHRERIIGAERVAIRDWMASREFESDPAPCIDKLAVAFVIRSSYLQVILECAAIIAGDDYVHKTAGLIREKFHSEGLRKYQLRLREARSSIGKD